VALIARIVLLDLLISTMTTNSDKKQSRSGVRQNFLSLQIFSTAQGANPMVLIFHSVSTVVFVDAQRSEVFKPVHIVMTMVVTY
jgi:hypothetical protein